MKKFAELFDESQNPLTKIPAEIKSILFAKNYKAALEELIDTIENDKSHKHGVFFWSSKIAREYENVDRLKLSSIYLKWLKKSNPEKFLKLTEELMHGDPLSVWIDDFNSSDAPQFKGKTKEERHKMAIAAYLSAKQKLVDEDVDDILSDSFFDSLFESDEYINEEVNEIIEAIWEDVITQLFDDNSICNIVEDAVSRYENLLFEEIKGLPDGSQIVFGKVIKDGDQIGVVKDKKFYPIKDRDAKDVDTSKATVKNVFRRMKHEIRSIAADLGESKKSIAKAFAQKDVQSALSKVGYSAKEAGEASSKTVGLINTGLSQSFQEIEKAGGLDGLRKGTQKIDEFLDKHPVVKKMAGPLVAGALLYQWNNMSFSGDFNDDFDITSMINAATGSYALSDLVSSANGAKALTQLAVGMETGKILGSAVSFPWKLGIQAAIVYTGAKKVGNSDLAKKAMSKIKGMKSNKDESVIAESAASIDKILKDLLSDPKNVYVIDAINDGKKSVVVDFISKNIKDKKQQKEIIELIFK